MSALEVLHCDNHVLAVAKPAGLPTVPDASGDTSLYDQAREWVRVTYGKPGQAWLGVVHRLDRPVSGLVVFARTSKAAARLSASFRSHACEKGYLGISEGRAPAQAGELEQWLLKDEAKNRVRIVASGTPGARGARTRWRVLERRGALSLLALEPLTGRPHQLRVAAASLGLVLLGDLKYGAERALPDQSIALHCYRLRLSHPTSASPLELELRPPERAPWSVFGAAGAAGESETRE